MEAPDKHERTPGQESRSQSKKCPVPWYGKLGIYAFMFFLIKGLLWLTVPAVLAYLAAK